MNNGDNINDHMPKLPKTRASDFIVFVLYAILKLQLAGLFKEFFLHCGTDTSTRAKDLNSF